MEIEGISHRKVRSAIKEVTKRNVCKEAVKETKQILDGILEEISKRALEQLKSENEIRAIQHAKRLKKITKSHVQQGWEYLNISRNGLKADVVSTLRQGSKTSTPTPLSTEVTVYE